MSETKKKKVTAAAAESEPALEKQEAEVLGFPEGAAELEAVSKAKPKRAPAKKKKVEPEADAESSDEAQEEKTAEEAELPKEYVPVPPPKEMRTVFIDRPQQDNEEGLRAMLDWREIRSGVRINRVCTGTVTGLERVSETREIAVVTYKGYRVLIPLEEMLSDHELAKIEDDFQLHRRAAQMLGAEVDFAILGVDEDNRSVVGSRKEALRRKAEHYFFTEGDNQITVGRAVEARIVAVGRLAVRAEVFGIETVVSCLNLAWEWIPDLRERYKVGGRLFLRVNEIRGDSPETLFIACDGKSVLSNPDEENLMRCKRQSRYIGTVVNLRSSAILVRLSNGVNGIATGCVSEKLPARGDEVCFLVTTIHPDEGLVRGIVTRTIRKCY